MSLALSLWHIQMLLDKATCITHWNRETGAGVFRNVFSQMWSLLHSLFGLISAGGDAVGTKNVNYRQFFFDLPLAFRLIAPADLIQKPQTGINACMCIYTHANWRSLLMVSEAFPFTITANSPQPFTPSHHSSSSLPPFSSLHIVPQTRDPHK